MTLRNITMPPCSNDAVLRSLGAWNTMVMVALSNAKLCPGRDTHLLSDRGLVGELSLVESGAVADMCKVSRAQSSGFCSPALFCCHHHFLNTIIKPVMHVCIDKKMVKTHDLFLSLHIRHLELEHSKTQHPTIGNILAGRCDMDQTHNSVGNPVALL